VAYRLIDQQLSSDLLGIDRTEELFPEYGKGKAVIYMSSSLTPSHIRAIETELHNREVHLTAPIVQEGRALHIQFEKRIAPLLIIGGIVGLVVAAGAALLGWQVFQQLGDISPYLLVALGVGGAILVWYMVR